jgi:hypothetical protein
MAEYATPIEVRRLTRAELSRIAEIDRTEHIDLLYEQHGTDLVERRGMWDAPAWDGNGHGEHSVTAHRLVLERFVDARAVTSSRRCRCRNCTISNPRTST